MTDTASGDALEEGRVKEGGMLFQWSGKTCLQESVNRDLKARRTESCTDDEDRFRQWDK